MSPALSKTNHRSSDSYLSYQSGGLPTLGIDHISDGILALSGRFIIVVLVVMVPGCGPGPSDEMSRNATTTRTSDAVTYLETEINQTTPASSPVRIPSTLDTSSTKTEFLIVPPWIAKDLASSDTHVKIEALNRWAQEATVGSVDPLLLALEDEDEAVKATALSLLEQDWRRKQ